MAQLNTKTFLERLRAPIMGVRLSSGRYLRTHLDHELEYTRRAYIPAYEALLVRLRKAGLEGV